MEAWVVPKDHRELVNSLPRESGDWEGRLARWLAWADTIVEKERAFEEVMERIREGRSRDSLENLRASIQQAEEAGDETAVTHLVLEYNRLMKSSLSRQEES